MTRRDSLVATGCVMALTANPLRAQSANMVLTIARKHHDSICTSGYLAVDGKIIAYALEKPWRDNQPLISSIPTGSYAATLRYDHADRWRIELVDVPGRTNVQIHAGNVPADTQGCILVGLSLGSDLCSVRDSAAAYTKLRTAFYGSPNPVSTPNKAITVKVEQ